MHSYNRKISVDIPSYEFTLFRLLWALLNDKVSQKNVRMGVIPSVILGGPKETHPKLIEWCLKVGIYKSKNLLNVVYVIYSGIFCKVSSQKIKHWTSYEIFSGGIDILVAEK